MKNRSKSAIASVLFADLSMIENGLEERKTNYEASMLVALAYIAISMLQIQTLADDEL